MRFRPLNAKIRGRLLASGLFMIGLSTAAGLTTPPVEATGTEPDRNAVSVSATAASHCEADVRLDPMTWHLRS